MRVLTNQAVINAVYEAADARGQDGWDWLLKAGLTYLAGDRNAPYSGPDVEDIATLGQGERHAILERLPAAQADHAEVTYTNQDVINAVYAAAQEHGQDGWGWLLETGLASLASNRGALYAGPDLATVRGLGDEARSLILSHLGEGRTRFEGGTYSVQFYRGDYVPRQEQAVKDNCVAYVEQHFNAGPRSAGYALVITPDPNPFQVPPLKR